MAEIENDFSLKQLVYPLTTIKVIFWLIGIGLVVYSFGFFNEFVWDDLPYIVNNPDVYSINIPYLLKENSFNSSLGQYRALTAIYFAVVHALAGNTPFLYHFLQAVIHIVNSILVFMVLKIFIKNSWAFWGAAVFLTHPLQVESAGYISSTGNTLFFMWGILGLFIGMQQNSKPIKMLIMAGCFTLSALAKETGMLFVVILVIYQALFNSRKWLIYTVYGFGSLLCYLAIRLGLGHIFWNQKIIDSIIPITHLSFGQRMMNLPAIEWYYLKNFIFPDKLLIDQLWVVQKLDLGQFYIPLIADAVLFTGSVILGFYLYKAKKNIKAYLFFVLWLGLGLVAHSQVVILDATVADRWFYFPIVGIIGMFGVGFSGLKSKASGLIGILIIGTLCMRTVVRIADWKNPLTLYSHDSQISDNFDLENSLANELNKAGRSTEAIEHFKKSITLFPHENNLLNLALTYDVNQEKALAEKYYFAALGAKNMAQVPYPHVHRELLYVRLAVVVGLHDKQKAAEVVKVGLVDYPESHQLQQLEERYK